ncbi:MAG TPA: GTPase [Candidatus Thermoplasmatota archaeon]|nr:GTPase [Candidatus Thermoplasmatota archaeon]
MASRRKRVEPEYEAFVFGQPRAKQFAWSDIRPILSAERLQDKVFHRASFITIDDPHAFYRRKKTAIARITSVGDTSKDTLLAYVQAFPDFDRMHPFYRELCSTLVDVRRMRADLKRLQRCAELISGVCQKNLRQMKTAARKDFLEMKRKEVYGRVGSIIQEIAPALSRLEGARRRLREIPTLDTDVPILVVAGLPNVGKSALVARICSAKPMIAPYPFTTQGIIVGHTQIGGRTVQVVDTPGILDRPAAERNEIEARALAAVRHLGDLVVFLFDPTPGAVAGMKAQEHLLAEVRALFKERMILEVENKVDAVRLKSPRMKISALTGKGVGELVEHLTSVLPARGGKPKWAAEEE